MSVANLVGVNERFIWRKQSGTRKTNPVRLQYALKFLVLTETFSRYRVGVYFGIVSIVYITNRGLYLLQMSADVYFQLLEGVAVLSTDSSSFLLNT